MMAKRNRNTYTFITNNDTYTSVVTDGIFFFIYFSLYISQWDVLTKFYKDSVRTSQRTPYSCFRKNNR